MNRVSLYIPTDHGKSEYWIKEAQETFSEWFGGATTFPAMGSWRSQDGTAELEPVVVVQSIIPDTANQDEATSGVKILAQTIKIALDQEAVLLTFDTVEAVLV